MEENNSNNIQQKIQNDLTYLRGINGELDMNEVSQELKILSYELSKIINPAD